MDTNGNDGKVVVLQEDGELVEEDIEGLWGEMERRFVGQPTTIKKKRLFLENLSESGVVNSSVALAGWDKAAAYDHRHRDPTFAEAWEIALSLSADMLEDEVHRRGVVGVDEPIVYQGKIQMVHTDPNNVDSPLIPATVRRKSDILLMFLLKGRRPDRFREKGTEVNIQNNNLNVTAGEQAKDKLLTALGINA